MLVYILLLGFICFDFWLEHYLTKKGTLSKETKFTKFLNFVFKYRVLTIFTIVFISTFRAVGVGGDTVHYFRYYDILQNEYYYYYDYEIGYTALNFLLAVVFRFDFRVLFFIVSLFTAICFTLFINKLSCNKLMSFLLFVMFGVFGQSLSALRQIIAIGFILISLMYIVDNKMWRGTVFILCAGLFHVTALLCLIIIPMKYIKLNHWWILGLSIFSCVFAFTLPYILQLIELIIPQLSFYEQYFIVEAKHFFEGPSLLNSLYSIGMIAIYAVLYLARYKWFKEELENDKIFTYFLTLFTIIPLIRIAGLIIGLESLLNRINMYFFFLLIILVPRFLECLKRFNHQDWIYGLAYFGAFAYMILLYIFHDTCSVVPYEFWF